jgi:transposase
LKLDTSQHLLALSRAEANARKHLRLLAISHFLEGENRTQIALNLNVSRRSVKTWVSNYLSDGVTGFEAKKAP